jgi:hypothetical protein
MIELQVLAALGRMDRARERIQTIVRGAMLRSER